MRRAGLRLGAHTDRLVLHMAVLTAGGLAVPAALSTGAAASELIATSRSWEPIDYGLLGLTAVFMSGLTYSKYWLLLNLRPDSFLALRGAKYSLASLALWLVLDLGPISLIRYPSPYLLDDLETERGVCSVCGKVFAVFAFAYVGVNRCRTNSLRF